MTDQPAQLTNLEAAAAIILHVLGNQAPASGDTGWLAAYVVAGLVEVADAIRDLTRSLNR